MRALQPDFARLKTLGVRGVMVTALATSPEFDFVSRFFAPGVGIDEDPVTGSAHCCLAPYWSLVLNKREFTAYQASARGGDRQGAPARQPGDPQRSGRDRVPGAAIGLSPPRRSDFSRYV